MADVMHQFEIKKIAPIEFNNYDVSFTNSSLCMVLSALLVLVVFYFCLRTSRIVVREVKLFALQVVYSVQDVCLGRAVSECVGVAVSGGHYHILLCLRIVNYLCGVEPIHYAIALAKEHSAL